MLDEDVDTAGKAWQKFSKPQANGGVAVLLISRALDMGSNLPPIDLSLRLSSYVDVTVYLYIRDIWNRRDVDAKEVVDGVILLFRNIKAHDSVFLRLTPAEAASLGCEDGIVISLTTCLSGDGGHSNSTFNK